MSWIIMELRAIKENDDDIIENGLYHCSHLRSWNGLDAGQTGYPCNLSHDLKVWIDYNKDGIIERLTINKISIKR